MDIKYRAVNIFLLLILCLVRKYLGKQQDIQCKLKYACLIMYYLKKIFFPMFGLLLLSSFLDMYYYFATDVILSRRIKLWMSSSSLSYLSFLCCWQVFFFFRFYCFTSFLFLYSTWIQIMSSILKSEIAITVLIARWRQLAILVFQWAV